MSITVAERVNSQSGSATQKELRYIVSGSEVHADVLAALLDSGAGGAPATFAGLVRNDQAASVDLIEGRTDIWEGRVIYEPSTLVPFQTGDTGFSFDTGGATQHITQSLETISATAAAGNASDFKGAIGFDGSNVQGVDIVVPQFNFSVTRYVATASMTTEYIGSLYELTGKVNNGSFSIVLDGQTIGFAEGELLLDKVQGSKRKSQGDWAVQYDFRASKNETNLQIGDITVPSKKGWEFLWVLYANDTHEGRLVKTPVQVNVEQVYKTGDFSLLEPPTS